MTSIVRAGGLCGRYVPRESLEAHQFTAMYVLMRSHFLGVDRATFDADLRRKNWVILLEDGRGVLRGFSTLLVYPEVIHERPLTVVYSGDTIVAPEWWGSSSLPLTWLRAVRQLAPQYGSREVYWLLLTSGFRTYRFLPVFFREFHPSASIGSFAERERTLAEALARAQFGDLYDPSTGIVRFPRPQVLAPELIEVPAARARDPHVAHFLAHNPGYVRGDELVCVARIADDNLTRAGLRFMRSA